MGRFGALARFVAALAVSLLPHRLWPRFVYPMTEHNDLEAIRRSVRYDLPEKLT